MARTGVDSRAVSPVIGATLLVAITVLLAAVIAVIVLDVDDGLSESPSAAVDVSEARFTDSEDCPGSEEVAIDVTLTHFERAETIYVLADGGQRETLWADPGTATVGTTKRVANEAVGNGGTDVDIGGGDIAICPGDRETFRFYAEYDGQTLSLQTFTTS